jgi:ParB family chromosome partitioning protein
MHPADEFEAFRSLLDNGYSTADVAARFGISELTVQKRLALARVSPVLIQKYREGEMTLELLQAFTISDDHQAQEQVWSQLQRWNRQPHTIRHMLAQDDLPGSDKRVRFVGVSAYEAAGGAVKRDLFADDDSGEGVYICDAELLHRLLQEKLANTAETLQAQGWKWVEIQPETDYRHLGTFRRVHAEPKPLPAKQRAKLKALETEYSELTEDLDENSQEDEEDEEARARYARLEKVESQIDAIREAQEPDYPAAVKASAGAIVSLAHDGTLQITYGLVRKEDEASFSSDRSTEHESNPEPDHSLETEEKRSAYSAALVESLTAHKTAAIAAELTQNVPIALAAVVYTFAIQEFALDLRLYGTKTCLQLAQSHPSLERASDSSALAFLQQQQRSAWLAELPGNPANLWTWCLAQTMDKLL